MRKITTLALFLAAIGLAGCDQMLARSWGGTVIVKQPADTQLVTMTWKGDSLWLLYYQPSTKRCIFEEDSSIGALEGKVIIENCNPATLPVTGK